MKPFFKKTGSFFFTAMLLFILLTGCGPSEEKIAEAQNKYTELTNIHNQVVDAHKTISDPSLDTKLDALSEKLDQIDDFNLNEMKDNEIDLLITSMDSMITSYQEALSSISQIKTDEDAAVIITIPLALSNTSGLTFENISLYEKGDTSEKENLLPEGTVFENGQHITGLFIYRDVSYTHWILALTDTDQNNYEIELPVKTYPEEGCTLILAYDLEDLGITVSVKHD